VVRNWTAEEFTQEVKAGYDMISLTSGVSITYITLGVWSVKVTLTGSADSDGKSEPLMSKIQNPMFGDEQAEDGGLTAPTEK
jgi:hypothetical protein